MESVAYLKRMIGNERTLVITCIECGLDIEHQYSTGEIFQYTVLGNVLNPEDRLQHENIVSFIRFKRCSRIIIVGHHHCKALNYLMNGLTKESPIRNLGNYISGIYRDNHGPLLRAEQAERMIVEMNVIHQCHALLTMTEIRDLVESGKISITGVVIDPSGHHKQVYTNGVGYNHFVSMN